MWPATSSLSPLHQAISSMETLGQSEAPTLWCHNQVVSKATIEQWDNKTMGRRSFSSSCGLQCQEAGWVVEIRRGVRLVYRRDRSYPVLKRSLTQLTNMKKGILDVWSDRKETFMQWPVMIWIQVSSHLASCVPSQAKVLALWLRWVQTLYWAIVFLLLENSKNYTMTFINCIESIPQTVNPPSHLPQSWSDSRVWL